MGVLTGNQKGQAAGAPPLNPGVLGDVKYHLSLGPIGQRKTYQDKVSKQDVIDSMKMNQPKKGILDNKFVRGVRAVGLGLDRSAVGTAQGISGLTDLVTPGKGHSRVTNSVNGAATNLDQRAKNQQLNAPLYKAGQFTGDVGQLVLGSELAKGAEGVGKASTVGTKAAALSDVVKGSKLAEALNSAREGSKAVDVAAKSAKYLTNPARLATVVGNVALDQGQRSGKNQKITAKNIATSAGVNFGLLGLGEVAQKAASDHIASKIATGLTSSSKVSKAPTSVPVKDLKIGTDAKGPVDKARVSEYASRAKNGGTIEPLDVIKKDGDYYVQDGKHRLMGLQQAGVQNAPVRVMNADVESPTLSTRVGSTSGRTAYTPEVSKTLDKINLATPTPGKGVGSEIKNLFTPGGGLEGKQIANDLRATTGANALAKNQETLAAKNDIKFFQNMSPGEHANFIQKVESGVRQDTPELQGMADKLRTAQDSDFKIAQSLKPNITKVENYFPRAGFWDNSSKQVDDFVNKFQTNTLGGKPSALEHRAFPTIYDGIKAGLTPKETNPAIIALNSRTQLLKAKAAQDFFDQQVKLGRDPALVKEYIDRVIGKGLEGSATYQTAKQAGYAINNLQLSLSGFHVAGTGINAVVSQFANGLQDLAHGNIIKGGIDIAKSPIAPLDYLFKGNKILKDYKAGNITSDIKNIAEGGGRIGAQVDYKATGLAKSIDQLTSGNLKEAGKGLAMAPLRAFSDAAKPIMEYWVPRVKAGATKELIDRKLGELGPNASADAVRAAKADAIDSIDNRFGQLVKDNLLWKKSLKDGSGLLMRSPGWNIGTVREVGGGATDLLSKTARGKGLSERSAYTASLAATTMLLGTAISYMFTGKAPKDPIDYFYPKTGKIDKNGNEERVSLPTYAKDIFSFSHNPGQTIANKASPVISLGQQLAHNKDYYGNQIRNPEDSGGTQVKQTGQYLEKSLLPFSLSGASQRVDKGASTKAQSFFGLNPAPGYITKSPFEQKVSNALNQTLGSKSLTPEESAKSQAKSAAKQPNPSADNTSLAKSFTYLRKVNPGKALQLYKSSSPTDRAKLQGVSQSSLEKALNDSNLRKRGINPKTGRPIQHRKK